MSSEWPVRTILDCASDEPYSTQIGPFGKALTPAEYTDSGVPLLRGVNVNTGRFFDDGFVFVSEQTADRLSKFESFPNDVLLVHKGTLGKIGIMPRTRRHQRYLMGNSMLRVRCNQAILRPLYLYYWLSSRFGMHYLQSRVSQVGVPQLQRPLTTLREAKFPVPPISIQDRVIRILDELDSKIELNRRMNETLEATARALFKSWFVDFDPVRAKLDGRRPHGMAPQTAALFPDSFEHVHGELLPEKWTRSTWGEIANLRYGKSLKGYRENNGNVEVFGTNGPIGWTTEMPHLQSGIVIGRKGAYRGVHYSRRPFYVIDTAFYLETGTALSDAWAYHELRRVDINTLDSGSAIPSTSKGDFNSIPVIVPPFDLQSEFERHFRQLDDISENIFRESQTLAELRDTLLPKLLSGELTVPEAEEIAEDVTA